MKKILSLFLVVLVIGTGLVGCSQPSEPISLNEIAPMTLTPDQKEIVALLAGGKQEILLFDYQTEETYTTMECWVDVYENGELVDRHEGFLTQNNTAIPWDGRLAVLINHDADIQYSFTLSDGDGTRISNAISSIAIKDDSLIRGYGPINEPVEIAPHKEIVLYTSIYSEDTIVSFSDMQRYVNEPELLSGYSAVQMIKCRFE